MGLSQGKIDRSENHFAEEFVVAIDQLTDYVTTKKNSRRMNHFDDWVEMHEQCGRNLCFD